MPGQVTLPTTHIVGAGAIADTDRPELQTIELQIPSAGLTIKNFTRYSYQSHFLTPADGWSFTIEDDERIATVQAAVVPGALVTLSINGHVQASGYVDSVDVENSRGSGTQLTVAGRDKLGQVVDASADPTIYFPENMALGDILIKLLGPFGFDAFLEDNDANKSVITGSKYGVPFTKGGKKKGPHALKRFITHQLRPYPREGCFAFCSRIAQRLGLWIWLSADGETVIVSTPSFNQPTKYNLIRTATGHGATNTILSGGVKLDLCEQPDVVIAEGFSGGAEWGHSSVRCMALNPLTTVDANGLTVQSIEDFILKFPDAKKNLVTWPDVPKSARVLKREALPTGEAPAPRLMYLHDDESHTLDEVIAFTQREMSLKMRHAATARYTVEGHTQGGIPWCVDAMVDVRDEVCGFEGPMWILSRTFEKSRSGGTVTHLELVLPGTLQF